MSQKIDLDFSLSSPEPMELIKAICRELEPFNKGLPTLVTDGIDKYTDTKDWVDEILPLYEYGMGASWGYDPIRGHEEASIGYYTYDRTVRICIYNYELTDAQSVMEMLAPLPWTIASFFRIYNDETWEKHYSISLNDPSNPIGWACAFKGEGHERLLSRRWLEYNPWYLIRDEKNDVSFIQFHDLTDPGLALEQAKKGHQAMNKGFIDKTYSLNNPPYKIQFNRELRGVYFDETQELHVVIPAGVAATIDQMNDYCTAKYYQVFKQGTVKKLAFVFIEGKEAEPYIRDLWLRDIECLGIDPSGERYKADENYYPVYYLPKWVKRLQQREQLSELEFKKLELAEVEQKIENLLEFTNLFGGKLTGEPNQIHYEAQISLVKDFDKILRKQRVIKQNIEKEIAELEENSNS